MHALAINCGSSSIKGKLYHIASKEAALEVVASLSVSNISSKGEKVKIKVQWEGDKGKDVDEEGEDGGSVDCEHCMLYQGGVLAYDRPELGPAAAGQADSVWRGGQVGYQIHRAPSVS